MVYRVIDPFWLKKAAEMKTGWDEYADSAEDGERPETVQSTVHERRLISNKSEA